MPDREKVLKALEHHKETAVCNGCPYAEDIDTAQGYCPIYDDAIALLREQEEEQKRIVIWLGKFCAHADRQFQPCFTDEQNIEYFRQKMKQQFGWEVRVGD